MKAMSGHVRGRIVSLTASVVIIGLMVLPGCGLAAAPIIGHHAPDFILADLNGNAVRLSDFRGNVVFLNFWATWCLPCRVEMPEMEELYREYSDRDVIIMELTWAKAGAL